MSGFRSQPRGRGTGETSPAQSADDVPSFVRQLVAGQTKRRWINLEAERLHWERFGNPEDGTHDTLIWCHTEATETWEAAQIDGREGSHYYGDACLGGHGELADIEAREAEQSDGYGCGQ